MRRGLLEGPYRPSLGTDLLFFCVADLPDVDRIRALITFTNFKLNQVSLAYSSVYFGCMNEEVITIFPSNEPKSFHIVEPLHSSCRHEPTAPKQVIELDC